MTLLSYLNKETHGEDKSNKDLSQDGGKKRRRTYKKCVKKCKKTCGKKFKKYHRSRRFRRQRGGGTCGKQVDGFQEGGGKSRRQRGGGRRTRSCGKY